MLGLTASCITIKFNARGWGGIPIRVSSSLDVLFGLLIDRSWLVSTLDYVLLKSLIETGDNAQKFFKIIGW